MSVENNVLSNSVNETYFKSKNLNFFVFENTRIDTNLFLNASKQVVELIEQMGKIFAPVTYDMNNNINKIYSVYEKDKNKNKYLDELLLREKENNDNNGIISVLWLKRALHLFQRFFELIVQAHGNIPPSLNAFLEESYNEILRPYHGWFTQKLFYMVCLKEITSKQFFEILSPSCNTNIEEVLIIDDMKVFTDNLKECIVNISQFYIEHNLENIEPV